MTDDAVAPERAVGRRTVLAGAALASGTMALSVAGSPAARAASAGSASVPADPFALGVAAGDPLPTGLILWTRLVNDPLDATSMPARDIEVRYEVATDALFRHVVLRDDTLARARFAHSVHADVRDLKPGTDYWYRFKVGGSVSPTGRARAAPAPTARPSSLVFAVANCQDMQNGYWPAYAGIAEEDLDVVLHLGDYIYEYDAHSSYPDRQHSATATPGLDQLVTLADYRARHAQYKLDPALRAAHANAAWITTWDDHETENNYAGYTDEIDDVGARFQPPAQFQLERAAAYQAYYEHMPIRVSYLPGSSSLQLYRRFDFGDLARFNVLDTRQYRTDQPGGFPNDFGPEGAGVANQNGTLFGGVQGRWLQAGLAGSHAVWNVIAQQVMMSRTRFPNPTTIPLPFLSNLDQWDGYAPARTRLLQFIADQAISNPVVLSGDIHSTWMNDLVINPDDPAAQVMASEFVSTSISSDFPIAFDAPIKATLPQLNPWTRYFDGSRRGYLRMTLDRDRWLAEARTVDSITTRTSPVATTARYAVTSGTPGIIPA
jgi:alkaline phosphatase D